MSLPAISKHLKVLERAGLIARGREAQWRPCRLAAGSAQGRRRLGGAVSAFLGGEFRSAGRLSARAPKEGEERWLQEVVPQSESDERVLVIERIFDAPRELVWKAWTEPEHMAKWGPRGFTSTVLKRAPAGRRLPNPYARARRRRPLDAGRLSRVRGAGTSEHGGELGGCGGESDKSRHVTTVTLKEHDGKTKLTLCDWFRVPHSPRCASGRLEQFPGLPGRIPGDGLVAFA